NSLPGEILFLPETLASPRRGGLHPLRIHPWEWTTLRGPFLPSRAPPGELERLRVPNCTTDTSTTRHFPSWPSAYSTKTIRVRSFALPWDASAANKLPLG